MQQFLNNLKNSNTINYEQTWGTNENVFTYVQLRLALTFLSKSRYQKKMKKFEEFTQPPMHTFLCPTYFVLRNLLNLAR